MATHSCEGQIVESKIVIGKTILDCGMMDESKSESSNSLNKNCCHNQYQSLQVNDDFGGNTNIELPSVQAYFLPAFVYTFLLPQQLVSDNLVEGLDYSPPHYKQDLSVLLQNFRI